MSEELDLSPPEVPEPTLLESILRYGLFLGAIFQLICILAVIMPASKSHDQVSGLHLEGQESDPVFKYCSHPKKYAFLLSGQQESNDMR